jgi:hypothetical protein
VWLKVLSAEQQNLFLCGNAASRLFPGRLFFDEDKLAVFDFDVLDVIRQLELIVLLG